MSARDREALRAVVRGDVQGVGFRRATVARATELGVLGWVRHGEAGALAVHAEGPRPALDALVAFLGAGPPGARVTGVDLAPAKVEGHEQFAVRGVPAGVFVVQARPGARPRFELRIEVDGILRSWTVPKGPSLDPAAKRLAVEAGDHRAAHAAFAAELARGEAVAWDCGRYEQGGRVPWPEALERGHAVFVLHGAKLRGGFALQRTRPGPQPHWLLVKRRDEAARPGSDVVAERPDPVDAAVLDELGA
jgi:DNA ligase D-like protein (predicted 3'-phosphoesterase)